jgi:hypothetical protein
MGLRKQLEPIFTHYGVNVAFSGHDHIYERTVPQNGVQYFVSGAAGKRAGVDKKSSLSAASFDDDNHFMAIEVSDSQIDFKAITQAGDVIDNGLVKQA